MSAADSAAGRRDCLRRPVMTLVLLWIALFGMWPLADPGHEDLSSPLVWIDLFLHFGAGWLLLDREIDRRADLRAAQYNDSCEARDT